MIRKSLLAAAAVSFATAGLAADLPSKKAPPQAVAAPFFLVNSNTLSYSYQFGATAPFNPAGKFGKNVFSFTHFDIWAYGTNFLNIDLLKSPSVDPAVGGGSGATEIYGLFRSTLGLNQLTGTKSFTMGMLSNVSLAFGADFNSENNATAPAKKSLVAGLQFSFDLPYKLSLNVSPLYYKEWNHNADYATTNGGATEFNGTWAIETGYSVPVADLPLTLSGRFNVYGPKGNGTSWVDTNGDAVAKTKIEINSEQRLTLDVGKMAYGASRADLVNVFVAYRYWQNKFGINHSSCPANSCTENAVTTGVSVKF